MIVLVMNILALAIEFFIKQWSVLKLVNVIVFLLALFNINEPSSLFEKTPTLRPYLTTIHELLYGWQKSIGIT